MATAASIDIDTEANSVHLRDLTIFDDTLTTYLDQFEPDEYEQAVERALTVGAATLQLAETEKELEYVRREFENLHADMSDEVEDVQDEMEDKLGDDGVLADILDEYLGKEGALHEHIDEAFGEDGIFSERLDEELGEDGERIQQALDPDRDGTPTNRLLNRLKDEIDTIRQRLDEEAGEAEIRGKTSLKGDDFEDDLMVMLENTCSGTPHTFEYTGDDEGELSGRKVGDFVIELGDTGQTLVVEAKSSKNVSTPKMRDEMDEAIRNRDADYGLFVCECASYVPNEVGYLQEYEDFVAVCLSRDEDDEIDERLFQIGFNWAKIRTGHAAMETGEDIDTSRIQTKINEIESAIDQFSTIKRKCTSIRGSANDIDENLDAIRDDVIGQIHDIQGELAKS